MAQRANPSASTTKPGTVRVKGFQARPAATNTTVSSKMDGNSSPKTPKQAAVNKGPNTQYNAGTQTMGKTAKPAAPSGKPTQQGGQPRSYQNTMSGKGSQAG